MRPGRDLRTDRSGTASVEFAAAGLVILLLLLSTFQLATLFLAKRGLDHGVNRAARWISVNSKSATVAAALQQFQAAAGATVTDAGSCVGYAAGATVPSSAKCAVVVTIPSSPAVGSSTVTVQATYKWSPVGTITGLTATTLQSTVVLAFQN